MSLLDGTVLDLAKLVRTHRERMDELETRIKALEDGIDALRKGVKADVPKCPEHGRYLRTVVGSQIWSCDQEWEYKGKTYPGHSYTTLALHAAGVNVHFYD